MTLLKFVLSRYIKNGVIRLLTTCWVIFKVKHPIGRSWQGSTLSGLTAHNPQLCTQVQPCSSWVVAPIALARSAVPLAMPACIKLRMFPDQRGRLVAGARALVACDS